MAFPSTVGTKPDTLANAWEGSRQVAGAIKTHAQTLRAQSLAGPVSSSSLLGFLVAVAEAKTRLNVYSAVPGLAAYAQEQVDDPTLNIAAEFGALVDALDDIRDWGIANFPASGGYLLAVQFTADGRTTDRQFSTAALATFRTQLDALIATID
jgi:hypothetical protein